MKMLAKVLIASFALGGILLVYLILLGRKEELSVSFQPETTSNFLFATPSPLPAALMVPPNQNATEQLAGKFANQITAQNQTGPQTSDQGLSVSLNPKQTLDQMLQDSLKTQPTPQYISPMDLNVVADSQVASKTYVADLQRIVNATVGDWSQNNPLALLDAAMSSGDNSNLVALYNRLEQAKNELVKTPVPQNWFAFHRDVIAAINQMQSVVQQFANWQSDPLGAMIAVETYQKVGSTIQQLLNSFASRTKTEGLL